MDSTPTENTPVPENIEHKGPQKFFAVTSITSIVSRATLKVIAVSVISILVVLLAVFGILWHERARIFRSFASGYAQSVAGAEQSAPDKSGIPAIGTLPGTSNDLPAIFSDQQMVENAVQKANPAVVAITISKTEPKYTTSYQNINPFEQFFGNGDGSDDGSNPFGNFNIQVPTQTPDGTQEQEIGAGSGFIVSSDGLIVTNKHVVSDTGADYEVYLSNGKSYKATVLARDSVLDVAIVKIDATGLPYLNLGDSDSLKLGQSVIAIGNALGQFQNTVSVGVVSGLSRSITAGDSGNGATEALDQVIQTDAAINPGNSGGPLLDLDGQVIGVDTAIVQGSQNIGFALPIDSIKTVISSVEKTGKIVRPYLGLRYEVITPDVQKANNLSVDYGVIVLPGQGANELAVIPGSPADKAGIVENDIILDVDGVKLDDTHDLAQLIRGKNVGDTVTLTILAKGVQKDVQITLEAAPQGE